MLLNVPTKRPRKQPEEPHWREVCTPEQAEVLERLSATLKAAMDATTPDECTTEETDFHGLWIGLLLGSGECDTFGRAYSWATFVRYRTDLVR